jgi:uncharacterized membrane protein
MKIETTIHRGRMTLVALCLAGLLTGCANMSDSEKDTGRRTASGAGIGIAAGAAIGELATGQPIHGAVIGAAAGAVGGWLYDHHKKKEETPGY